VFVITAISFNLGGLGSSYFYRIPPTVVHYRDK